MTPDPYRRVDTDEVLRRVDVHARVGAELLGGLGAGEHGADDGAFAGELATAARNAAEHELADVAYDLARACLAVHANYSKDLLWVETPRSHEDLHVAIITLSDRVNPEGPRPTLPKPGPETDLRPALAALDLCTQLEGESERVLFLSAELPAVHEQWDVVRERAASLAERASTPAWKRCASILECYALIQQRDGAAALHLTERLRAKQGVDRVILSNACCAHALLGNTQQFLETARAFAACDPNDLGDYDWAASMRSSFTWFANELHLPVAEIADAFGLEQV